MANWLFYYFSPVFIPILGFVIGGLAVILSVIIQYIIGLHSEKNFIRIHLKYAKLLVGNFVTRKKDGDKIIINEYAFEPKALGYIIFSEFIVAGTTLFFSLGNFIHVSGGEPCNSLAVARDADCFSIHSKRYERTVRNCSLHLLEGTASELICYKMVYDFGTGLAIFGGCLYLLPILHSYIAGFIISNSGKDQFPKLIALFQLVFVLFIIICYVGCVVGLALEADDAVHIVNKTYIEVIFFLFFLFSTFITPWCCMGRDESRVYVLGNDGEINESFEHATLGDNERTPLNRGRRNPNNRRNRPQY